MYLPAAGTVLVPPSLPAVFSNNILMISIVDVYLEAQPLIPLLNRGCLRPTRTLPEERGIRRGFAGKESWN